MELLDNGTVLSLITFLPLVGALVVGVIPRAREEAIKWAALLTALVVGVLSVVMAVQFDYGSSAKFQLGTDLPWIESIGSNFHIGVDGISLPMVVLSAIITILAIIYSWDHWEEPRNPKAFLILILLLETGMNGTFVALDLILFFIFFELVLLPMYFMIGIWGDKTQNHRSVQPHDRDPAVRVDQVLLVHVVRFGVHAPVVPGALLQLG